MRFDDTLDTVLSARPQTPEARSAVWRQVVDLTGRGRVADVGRAVAALSELRDAVPLTVRSASARALFGASPPAPLVTLLAQDDIAVGAPVLRSATLAPDDWSALIPTLTPTARAILRHRRDLPVEAIRALESFGSVDFVLGDDGRQTDTVAPIVAEPEPVPAEPGPFVTVGRVALGLPLVAEALRQENDNDAPPPVADGGFRIADIVARIEAYQRHEPIAPVAIAKPAAERDRFRFECDANGTIRWADGEMRGAVTGLSLARPAHPGQPGVDAAVAGAWRGRASVRDGRLLVGAGTHSGTWLVNAVAVFDTASGRYVGHRGIARRPRVHEAAVSPFADAVRQLAHELRTPTNALAGFSEMIAAEMLGPVAEPYRVQAMAIHDDSRALLAAIDDVDTAARTATGALPVRPEDIVLTDMLGIVARDLAALAAERGATLALGRADAVVHADAPALHRLLSRMIGTLLGAARAGETIALTIESTGDSVALTANRPAAFDAYPGEQLYAIDAEACPISLLGAGFALRLARNLARELGGSLGIEARHLTLHLPAAVDRTLGQAQTS
ncbi:sensor histidine kinase [Sphingomonas sp. RS2018]